MEDKSRKSEETRSKIVRAFTDCLAYHGYAQTKLVDIAEKAGLATPHLRYYFKNKESILEYQYERVVARFEEAVFTLDAEDTRVWFDQLGELLLETNSSTTRARLILMEANILVAHSHHMKSLKRKYDENMLAAIEGRLSASQLSSPRRSAEMIFHFLTGLMLNTAFDNKEARAATLPLYKEFMTQLLVGEQTSSRKRKTK